MNRNKSQLGVLAEWWPQNGSLLEATLDTPIALGFIAYLATASRRGYADGWPTSIAKAVCASLSRNASRALLFEPIGTRLPIPDRHP